MNKTKLFFLLVGSPILTAVVTFIGINTSGGERWLWFTIWLALWTNWFRVLNNIGKEKPNETT